MIEIKNTTEYNSKKILSEKEVIDIVKNLKESGKKVGLCICGFDLLHPGHMSHLISAKSFCDFLVIGITADKFNSDRKGEGRPIFSEIIRAFAVSQLIPVDAVFISNYKGAVEPIKLIKPIFYIKGPDYINKQTPGIISEREAISSVQGEMRYTLDEKLSTTDIIKYIKEKIK